MNYNPLNDNQGNPSSTRYVYVFLYLLVGIIWGVTCIRSNTLLPLPESIITLLGIVITGKIGQGVLIEKPTSSNLSVCTTKDGND